MSTKTHPDDPRTSLPPSVVILGNDAQLAARPATPVQLAHACLAAGYRAVVPGSWGDELIAAATVQALGTQDARPAIHCACPHVARRLLAVGSDLSPYLVSLVAPPVAAARYLRHHAQGAVRITYVGRCPGAGDESIDARLTPEELLAQLAERGIDLRGQPLVFDSVIPPDRRRFRSQPGGLPAPDALWGGDMPTVEAIGEDDIVSEIAEKILSATNSLLDLAPAVGCACAGARAGEPDHRGRADIIALEPPRAPAAVVDEQVSLGLGLPLPVAARSVIDLIAPSSAASEGAAPDALESVPPVVDAPEVEQVVRRPRFTPQEEEAPAPAGRRRISGPTNRVVPGSMPVSSDQEGRVLPRAYVARRRSPRSGVPVIPDQSPPNRIADQPRHTSGSAVAATSRTELPSLPVTDSIAVPTPVEPRAKRDTRSAAALPLGEPVRTVNDAASAPRPVVAAQATAAPVAAVRSSDAELPIVQSVEPVRATNGRLATAAPQSLPLLVDQVRRTTERVSGEVRAIAARRPRTAVVIVLTAVVLLGVVIGYAAAGKRPDDRTSSEAGGQLDETRSAAPTGAESAAAREGALRRDSAPRRVAIPPRRGAAVRRAPQTNGIGAPPETTADSVSPVAVPAAPPTDRSDSLARAASDSVRRAAAKARNDSVVAERDALQKELDRRRARLDSIARRVQELRPDQR